MQCGWVGCQIFSISSRKAYFESAGHNLCCRPTDITSCIVRSTVQVKSPWSHTAQRPNQLPLHCPLFNENISCIRDSWMRQFSFLNVAATSTLSPFDMLRALLDSSVLVIFIGCHGETNVGKSVPCQAICTPMGWVFIKSDVLFPC